MFLVKQRNLSPKTNYSYQCTNEHNRIVNKDKENVLQGTLF